jgi:hypothetical protein
MGTALDGAQMYTAHGLDRMRFAVRKILALEYSLGRVSRPNEKWQECLVVESTVMTHIAAGIGPDEVENQALVLALLDEEEWQHTLLASRSRAAGARNGD